MFDCFGQILPLFDSTESKNKLLRTVAGGGVEQLANMKGRWDKFELMMESHELMVKEQVRQSHDNTCSSHDKSISCYIKSNL